MPEARLGKAFVNLADALVNGYEALDFLYLLCDRCHDVLEADAVGVLLSTEHDVLHLTAAAPEQDDVLELFRMQSHDGPSRAAFRTGRPVIEDNLAAAPECWPVFAAKALESGFHAAFGFPLRLRDDQIGALFVIPLGSRHTELLPPGRTAKRPLAAIPPTEGGRPMTQDHSRRRNPRSSASLSPAE